MAKQVQHAPGAEGTPVESSQEGENSSSIPSERETIAPPSGSTGEATSSPLGEEGEACSPPSGSKGETALSSSSGVDEACSPGEAEVAEVPMSASEVEFVHAPCLGELLGFSERGYPVISLAGRDDTLEVPTTVALARGDVGCAVLVSFVDGRAQQPVVTGRLLPPGPVEESTPAPARLSVEGPLEVESDGETVTIEAGRELVLRCGQASIRLRRDGRVEVRGVDVVSRASRANWIKGGSVALN